MMQQQIQAMIERKELEERLAGYLQKRPVAEQLEFLLGHGVAVSVGWDPSQVRQAVCDVICSAADAELAVPLHG
ncbi:MAG TPA: hypothetical protein VGK74_22325 [Symbiobacteriaceae bacterium]|jgi:hypothetical protein